MSDTTGPPVSTRVDMPCRPNQRATVEDVTDEQDPVILSPENQNDDDNDGDDDDTRSDEEGEGGAQDDKKSTRWMPPTVELSKVAYERIKRILRPPRLTGNGYKDPGLDLLLRSQLEAMMRFLWAYINPQSKSFDKWSAASLEMAKAVEWGLWFAQHFSHPP